MLKKLLILLLIPFILCACEKKTKEEITFSSWGSVTEVRIINKIISDFEHENPDISKFSSHSAELFSENSFVICFISGA